MFPADLTYNQGPVMKGILTAYSEDRSELVSQAPEGHVLCNHQLLWETLSPRAVTALPTSSLATSTWLGTVGILMLLAQ
jgi:hypothetical protein